MLSSPLPNDQSTTANAGSNSNPYLFSSFRFSEFPVDPEKRKSRKARQYILTNDVGTYSILPEDAFKRFVEKRLTREEKTFQELYEKGFILSQKSLSDLVERYRSRHAYLAYGPSLHIIVVTLRCNHKCLYCHASVVRMDQTEYDMTEETARRTVDMIFETTNPNITIEFQGGEPLANWPVVQFIIEYAQKKNETKRKNMRIVMVSNFTLLDDEKLNYLLAHNIGLNTSFDGPNFVHDKNRIMLGGPAQPIVKQWIKKINEATEREKYRGSASRPGAITTVTRYSLPHYKEVVDEYIDAGLRSIYLRPLNYLGFAKATWKTIGYSHEEYLEFHLKALEYVMDLNRAGFPMREEFARLFLLKIFSSTDPNHMDYRSPCGAAIGQIAYDYDGNVYTCDEGRMLGKMSDSSFKVGNLYKNTYEEMMGSPVVHAMCVASTTEGIPGYADYVYQPYDGVCPIYNYTHQQSIFGQMPSNHRYQLSRAILDQIFRYLQNPRDAQILKSWVQ